MILLIALKQKTGCLNEVDAIIHMGACSKTTETDENYLIYNNAVYSKMLLECAIQRNWRFIYASSAATYGDGAMGYSDQTIET